MSLLYHQTPLVESRAFGTFVEGQVWLKLETLQPSFSFKNRGMGFACKHYVSQGATQLITSSGGNAGLAVAYSGRVLGVKTSVVIPETTSTRAAKLIEDEGAEVIVHGASWDESHAYALKLKESGSAYVHPFDDPLVWEGHATLIDEVVQANVEPDAVVLSVGGAGLMCGVLEGMHRHGWRDVPLAAVETHGADSFYQSVENSELVKLDAITSLATTLGAKRVTPRALEWAEKHEIVTHRVSDRDAVQACFWFADQHRILVEPSCGASIATVCDPPDILRDKSCILLIVCGGAGVTLDQLKVWGEMVHLS